MLYSTAAWLRKADYAGLVCVVDISRYTMTDRREGVNYYTSSAAVDMNEALRQFIDSTDDMRNMLMVFVTSLEFLENTTRGLRSYDALRLRLTEDVKDTRVSNPIAPLVTILNA